MIAKRKKLAVYASWLVIWPAAIYILFSNTPLELADYKIDIFGFIVLASLVALFPLLMGDHPVFLTNVVSFAAFLYFGLLVEVLVIQAAIIFLMLKLGVGRVDFFRIPLNMLMFLIISLVSAYVYNLLGGNHGSDALSTGSAAVPVVAYVVTHVVVNQLLLHIIWRLFYDRKQKLLDSGVLWELISLILISPVGLMLYFVYTKIGPTAIYLVGFPFLLLSIMLRQFHKTSQVNYYLQTTGEIGHELTGSLGVKEVLDVFVKRVTELLPVDYMYVFDVTHGNSLKLIRYYNRFHKDEIPDLNLVENQSISGDTCKRGKGKHYHNRKKWRHLSNAYTPENAESVLSIPISRQNEIVGVITMYSTSPRAFFKYQYMILNILGGYLAVAIENARNYKKTKMESERCPLTSLYNYRYFENHLQILADEWENEHTSQPVSQILLDIDHFKSVNDQYGHEAGNEILCELAVRLEQVIGDRGIVARYGGEEFVALLPGMTVEESVPMAEKIRQTIYEKPFTAYEHILKDREPISIRISASIGVASYPEHCEDILELTRHADRAMYVGAKQRGRNRVASYEKLKQDAVT
ncbi:sensor domain-containing diguanylate cyclase [Halobacillus sp. A1]|uniref:sensor domain-containing diguanylate cyclase n=1 Tax=Halobacillus sp. A1 TaxID=2880262 RepID=UPI0020A67372|nr:sensor domain-containing diguanylate cyclase [Halobacillus sp. A1]MCP3030476.1 sensor domain-containing diguanylate cyclase [Halobacillus sp. A1]